MVSYRSVARERRQPWIVDVIDIDKGPDDARAKARSQRPDRSGLLQASSQVTPPTSAFARRWRPSDQECCWPGVCGPHTENVAIDGNRVTLASTRTADDHNIAPAAPA